MVTNALDEWEFVTSIAGGHDRLRATACESGPFSVVDDGCILCISVL